MNNKNRWITNRNKVVGIADNYHDYDGLINN